MCKGLTEIELVEANSHADALARAQPLTFYVTALRCDVRGTIIML